MFVLDFDEGVQDHRPTRIEIDGIGAQIRPLGLLWVPSVHLEVFDALGLAAADSG